MIEEMPVIDVDENGADVRGETYGFVATRKAVRAGHMVNRPVKLRYPDGTEVLSNEALITKAGMEAMRIQMVAEGIIPVAGSA